MKKGEQISKVYGSAEGEYVNVKGDINVLESKAFSASREP